LAKNALNTAAWLGVLDDLELRLDNANRAAATHSTENPTADAADLAAESPWEPPAGIGPIPHHLEERARDLLVCQQKLAGEIDGARRVTLRHLAALRSVPSAREAKRSVYLDVTG